MMLLTEYCQVAFISKLLIVIKGGNADEGISYRIKGKNIDKFSITDDTGILTYKTIQTSAHDSDTGD
jgi:hypothetical protein